MYDGPRVGAGSIGESGACQGEPSDTEPRAPRNGSAILTLTQIMDLLVLWTMVSTKGLTMNKANRCLTALALTVVATMACDTQSDVLTSTSQNRLQKSDGTWTNWCALELSSNSLSFDMAAFMTEAKQGLVCETTQSASTGCGLALDSQGCAWDERNCVDGHVQAITTATLGCPASRTAATTNASPDCASALANGATGDGCSWQGVCSRTTDDPCCIETAMCSNRFGGSQAVVQRTRICAPDCTQIAADATEPAISTCAAASSAVAYYAVSCDASLICIRTGPNTFVDIANAVSTDLWEPQLYFCANGKFMVASLPFAATVY